MVNLDDDQAQWHEDDNLLAQAVSYIAYSGNELAQLQLTCKRWHSVLQSDKLWRQVCRINFSLTKPELPIKPRDAMKGDSAMVPAAVQCKTYREAWLAWRTKLMSIGCVYHNCNASLYQRAAWAWQQLHVSHKQNHWRMFCVYDILV